MTMRGQDREMKVEDRAFYGAYADELERVQALLISEIQKLLDSISTDSETAVAEHLKCRIKGAESMKEKLLRKKLLTW